MESGTGTEAKILLCSQFIPSNMEATIMRLECGEVNEKAGKIEKKFRREKEQKMMIVGEDIKRPLMKEL